MHEPENLTAAVRRAAEVLHRVGALIVTAGAGIGVDSGLPDFRGTEGFWKAYPPIAKLGLSFSAMADPRWFRENPRLAWAFYGHRLHLYRTTIPHDGFTILQRVAADKSGGCFVFTSNVDGQFQKAGYDPDRIVECHGSIHHLQCTRPCGQDVWSAAGVMVPVNEDTFLAEGPLPRCRVCGELARPNILMFGDWNWVAGRADAQYARLEHWLREQHTAGRSLAVVEAGAGEAVPTVRNTSEQLAHRFGAVLIRINPTDWQVPAGHIAIPLGAREGIRRIVENL